MSLSKPVEWKSHATLLVALFACLPILAKSSFEIALENSKTHWAFQPIAQPSIPLASENLRAIDAFVLERLRQQNLSPAPPANRKTLIRRLYHDLHGLKPTLEEIDRFVEDKSPQAYSELIDRLLSSPRFGERWGRHWLDVARYADTKGYLAGGESRSYPFAYTYRDWVIKALNQDMPYDDFIRKQLAADALVPSPNHPDLAALGFLTAGPRFLNRKQLIIDDRIDLVTRGLMGFTVACARCHDHFHDPVPQEDYYSLYGIFNASSEPEELPLIGSSNEDSKLYLEFKAELEKLQHQVDDYLAEQLQFAQSEKGIMAYLELTLEGSHLNENDFEAQAAKRKLFPKLAKAWRTYLEVKSKGKVSFLTPLLSLSRSKDAISMIAQWKKNDNPPLPAFLRSKLQGPQLVGLTEVTQWYAEALSQAIRRTKTSDSKKGIEHAVTASNFPVHLSSAELEKHYDTKARNRTNALRAKVEKHRAEHPGSPPRAMTLQDNAKISEPRIFLRGNFNNRGDQVPRRFLVALSPADQPRKHYSKGSGRLELAESILSPHNPLTARVMVNRIWAHLVGKGIVRTPSDFGLMGDHPTHPMLLDYLSTRFRENGWKIKSLIREILLSQTYRRSSFTLDPKDPENLYLSSMNAKRLSFEAMRDGMLQVSEELDLHMGGLPQQMLKPPFSKRRGVYGFVDRQNLEPTLSIFDFANPNIHAPKRVETTVPQQALFALNDPFVIERAQKLAQDSIDLADRNPAKRAETISRFLYARILSRPPKPQELRTAQDFLGDKASLAKVEDLGQTLLVSNEFFFVD